MSQKRKLVDNHDHNYYIPHEKKIKVSQEDKDAKIIEIIKKEFNAELENREKEVLEIEQRIAEARKQLEYLKYAAIANYYSKGEITKVIREDGDALEEEALAKDQISLHPAIKRLVGKTPKNYSELVSKVPTRQAARNATTFFRKFVKEKKEEKPRYERNECSGKSIVKEEREETKIISLNSSRGRNQVKHLIAVGNTSKYLGENKLNSSISHKWLVYVKTKSHEPLENLVERVRFYLHPTYQPNDCVDIMSPPYKISRFGWGEFKIHVQLHFRPDLKQKPIQIYHRVKLDEKQTGLETFGAETVAELWLNTDSPHDVATEKIRNPKQYLVCKKFAKEEPVRNLTEEDLPSVTFRKCERTLPAHLYDHSYTRNSLQTGKERLATLFYSVPFTDIRSGVEFLLRRLPLISQDFQQDSPLQCSFPFIRSSEILYNHLHFAKRCSNEWFRAKFINRLLGLHPNLNDHTQWSTKKMISFARKHHYVPKSLETSCENIVISDDVKQEKIPSTTSTSSKIHTWISSRFSSERNDLDHFIDIESMPDAKKSSMPFSNSSISSKPIFYTLTDILSESSNEDQSEGKIALQVILKIFLEDLLRRSAANVTDDTPIHVDHIKSVLVRRKEFDFLTNNSLGIIS